jgi:hypothetical protein
MPIVEYSKKDLLRDKIISPAWYCIQIDNVGEWIPSSDQKSQNMIMEGTILFNADDGTKDYADVPIGGLGQWSFNSKGMGYSLGLTKSVAPQLGVNPDDIKEGQRFEYKSLEGKFVDIYIENDTYQGRMKNKVNHKYRAPKTLPSV